MSQELPPLPSKPEHYSYVRFRIEQIATFVNSPDAYEQLSSGTMNPLRAMVIRAVMLTPGLPHFLHERVGAPGYRQAGLDILGIGFHAVTVKDGEDSVRKYYRRTVGASEASQREIIKIWNAKQNMILAHLGEYAVPQFFEIGENPLNNTQSIVTATQARISSVGSINMFKPDSIPKSALHFFHDSQQMNLTNGNSAVPDLIGKENALIEASTGAIKLIDPIALVREDPVDEPGYHRVTSFLDEYLKTNSRPTK